MSLIKTVELPSFALVWTTLHLPAADLDHLLAKFFMDIGKRIGRRL